MFELGAAALIFGFNPLVIRHQGKHVVMLAVADLVTGLTIR